MENETGIALKIIFSTGGVLVTFIFAYVMYMIKTGQARLTAIEKEISSQKVTNQSFTEYRKYKDIRDVEFTESVKRIGDTLEDWRVEFNDKFKDLTGMIHEIQLDRAKNKTGK